jgi:hypothetical protein
MHARADVLQPTANCVIAVNRTRMQLVKLLIARLLIVRQATSAMLVNADLFAAKMTRRVEVFAFSKVYNFLI